MSSTPQPPIVLINPHGATRAQLLPVPNYPVPNTAVANHASHSGGNFLTVFAVLAVIAVISTIACLLGWLCNKRKLRQDRAKHKHSHAGPSNLHPQTSHRRENDLEFGFESHLPREKGTEFGFEKRMPNVQQAGKENMMNGYKPFTNGESKVDGNPHSHIQPRSRGG